MPIGTLWINHFGIYNEILCVHLIKYAVTRMLLRSTVNRNELPVVIECIKEKSQ